jgi:dihydrofolate reductase
MQTRRVRYRVAASLDGFIAGPNGEFDWIVPDPDFDWQQLLNQFDTFLVGRRTFEVMIAPGAPGLMPGMRTLVFSRTLRQGDHPGVTIVAEKPAETLAALRAAPGKDIWLFGGGSLFASLAEAGLVDMVEIAVMPVLLGQGIPLLASSAGRIGLKLAGQKADKNGVISLEYIVNPR